MSLGRARGIARPTALALALALPLVAAGCRRGADRAAFESAPVILISIDTLRADHLTAYGYADGSTPALDRLAKEGVLFESVISPAPQTLPAHVSLFTGLLPPRHGVRDNIGFTLQPGPRTLAERFKAAGLATGAAVSAHVLRAQTGIARGFDMFEDRLEIEGGAESLGSAQRDGAVAVESLARWIDAQGDRRFFAFLHLYEPHTPWAPPPAHARFRHPYDGDVAYADELVGRFLEPLRARGLLDRAVVAVTADHGEGLGDHGEEEHGMFVYREAVHVPLIVRLPGGARAGTRVKGTASLVDVAPTLLALGGQPSDGMDGVSLAEAIASGRTASRPAYSETLFPRYHFGWSELFAVTDDRYRFIRAPRPELFDAAADPGEKTNLYAARPNVAGPMNTWLERQAQAAPPPREAVSAETQEKLQALGYVGTAAVEAAAGSDLPDPKDKIADAEALKQAIALRRSGQLAESIGQYRKVLANNPRMIDAWEGLGFSLSDLGRPAEAIAALDKAVEVDPTRSGTHLALARIHALQGARERAVKHAEIAALRDPGPAFEVLAQIAMDRGDTARAAELAARSVQADDRREMSHFVLGDVARQQGRYEDALRSYRKAEEAVRLRRHAIVRNLHANMADCLARLGREPEAEKEFLKEIETIPYTREGRVGLATLYRSQGRDAEARAVLAGLIAAEPRPSADSYWTVVRAFSVLGDVEAARHWAGQARARFPSDPRFRSTRG
jgi:arylsulfatase A-like enzyme/tetratricopeptide (TPR) repeat protein